MNKLAPSQSTVYVSNLPFSLTNSDLHQIFSKYGKVVKVTVVKDKASRQSKGVAFVLFLAKKEAVACVRALHDSQLYGRTLKVSIAKDNGRSAEFIRRREYEDKSKCYECGELGHLSYVCPSNKLGARDRPKKKTKARKHRPQHQQEENEEEPELSEPETLGSVIRETMSNAPDPTPGLSTAKKFRPSSYFSDEEELTD